MVTGNCTPSEDYHKRYYQERREKLLAKERERLQKDRAKIRERKRRYYHAHRETIRLQKAAYRAARQAEFALYHHTYRQQHAEELREKDQAYRRAHAEEIRQKKHARYLKNREGILAKNAAYREAHRLQIRLANSAYARTPHGRERQRVSARQSYARNPERVKRWRRANPERVRAIQQRRRAAKYGVAHVLTLEEWHVIQNHFGHCCVYCGQKMADLTQDHIIPLSKGGTHTLMNVVPACHSCNSKKGNRAPLRPVQPLML